MTKAADLVREVQSVGGELIPLDSGKLRIKTPDPLPEHLMARLRQEKAGVISFLVYREHLARGFWQSLKGDIAAGPDKARAYTGAFQKDLRRLAELFSAPAKFRQLKG